VLEPYAGRSKFRNHGKRVVEGQWLMQAASDILLGWLPALEYDGHERDFYVRQLWDAKGSIDVDALSPEGLAIYGRVCGWTLARAHARSGDRIAIGAYLGKGDSFDHAITEFAERYADQNESDYGALTDAARSGRIEAEMDLD
jgi:predicted alpha/beta hydrolase